MPFHPSKWVVFDTNIYISAIRNGIGSSTYEELLQNLPHTYLSAVVSGELYAGCIDDITLRLVKQFTERFEKTGRVVTPTKTGIKPAWYWLKSIKAIRNINPNLLNCFGMF